MQAIQTKFLGPTNHNGSRYKAKCAAGSITIHTDYSLNYEGNHAAAARALIKKLGWDEYHGTWHSGELTDGSQVHVYAYPNNANLLRGVHSEEVKA